MDKLKKKLQAWRASDSREISTICAEILGYLDGYEDGQEDSSQWIQNQLTRAPAGLPTTIDKAITIGPPGTKDVIDSRF